MNRRFAVLGLAVAMCGTVLVAQTVQVPMMMMIAGQFSAGSLDKAFVDAHQQPGPLAVRVESVGPQLTRLQLTRNGVEEWTFESTAFMVSMGTGGTTIASADIVTMTKPRTVRISGFAMRIVSGGNILLLDGK